MYCRVVSGEVDKVMVCSDQDTSHRGMIKLAVKALYDTLTETIDDGKELVGLTQSVTIQFRDYPNIEDKLTDKDYTVGLYRLLLMWKVLRRELDLEWGKMPW